MTDLTVRGLVTIDATGATAGGAMAAKSFDEVAAATRRAKEEARALQSGSAAAQDQLSKTQQAINTATGVNSFGGQTKSSVEYGVALDALRAKFNPLFAASRQYELVLQDISTAEKMGAISAMEAEGARERLRLEFEASTIAANGAAKGFGSAGGSLANLSFQINDIASGLAMGQSPFTILAQQGGQVFQIWQMNPSIFKDLGGAITKAISPTTLLVGGLLSVGVAAATIYAKAIAHEKDMEAAVAGPGRAAGVTASQLDALAVSAANQGRIGVASAYQMAAAYVAGGQLSGDQVRKLTALTADYAATTRQTADQAQQELQGIFGDLSSGVGELDKKLQAFSPAQRQYIQNLIASGDYNKAVDATIDAMTPTLVRHEEHLTEIGRLWEQIKRNASDAQGAISRAANPNTSSLLADAQARLAELRAGKNYVQTDFGPVNIGANANAVADQAAVVERLLEKDRAERIAAQRGLDAATAKKISDEATPGLRGALPGFNDQQSLINQRNAAAKLLLNSDAMKESGLNLNQVTAGWDALSAAVDSYLTPAQRATQETQLSIQALRARTPEEKAAVAAAQVRLQLAGTTTTQEEREAQVLAASTAARAQATYQLYLQNEGTKIAIAGSIALAKAYAEGGQGALEAQARTQARQENLTSGINVETRTRQLLSLAIGGQVSSLEQQQAAQLRTSEATRIGNGLILSGALSYDRLNDFVQEHVQLLGLQDLRRTATNNGDKEAIVLLDQMIAKLPIMARAQREAAAVSDIRSGLGSLSDNAPAAAQGQRYAYAIQQAAVWRSQTLDDIRDVGDAHDALADDIETIFDDRMGQLYEEDLRRRRDWAAGVARANLDITRSHEDMASKSEGFVRGWDQDSEQLFVSFAKTGRLQIGGLVDFAIEQFARLAYEKSLASSFNAVGNGLLNLFAGAIGAGSGLSAPSYGAIPNLAPSIGTPLLAGARAGGGPVRRGQSYLVGEKGYEIFTPEQDGTISTHGDSVEAMSSQPPVYALPSGAGRADAPRITINMNNMSGTPLSASQGATTPDGNGGFDIEVLVDQFDGAMAQRHVDGRSKYTNALEQTGSIDPRRPR